MTGFEEETLRLMPDADSWLTSYREALAGTALGPTSREVVVDDSVYIADRAVPPVADPGWGESRIRTGVVMGAVQSGKTASMIGVLARCLDNGVDVAVVLGGTQVSLWLQTLRRIQTQLDTSALPVRRRLFLPHARGLANESRPGPEHLYTLTPRQVERALDRSRPLVVVAMKQTHHLGALSRTLHDVVYPVAEARGRPLRLLVIDDEADDSSIADDGLPWGSPELEEFKQVPRRIVDLWESRSRPGSTAGSNLFATYMAYTATPQANFLQEQHNPLAPRDFVAALRTPGPTGAVTPRELTYRVPEGLPGWYTGSDLYYGGVRAVLCPATEQADTGPGDRPTTSGTASGGKSSEDTADDELLVAAVRAYLVAAAVRLSRVPGRLGPASAQTARFTSAREAESSVAPVSCMLIHPSSAMDTHFEVERVVRRWWRGDGSQAFAGARDDMTIHEDLWTACLEDFRSSAELVAETYERDQPAAPVRSVPTWEAVRAALLEEILPGTRIEVVNSDPGAGERPDFAPWQDNEGWHAPRSHSTIFVAGNVMSRGLTLEGLLTTLFTRRTSAPLADTQMQMQRWFGYRGSYLDLCRVFVPAEQLSLFVQYADTDHALRSQVLAAMTSSAGSLPDFTVLQGTAFKATGKVSGLGARSLHPGPRPVVRHVNPPGTDGDNHELLRSFLTTAHARSTLVQDRRGLVTTTGLTLNEAADLLDSLRYQHHGRSHLDEQSWGTLERQVGISSSDPEYPLYRAPEIATEGVDLGTRSPYAIAAYLRFWAVCLDRNVRGLMTDDLPPQRWSLLDLDTKRHLQPTFRVGLRFGAAEPIETGPLAELGGLLGLEVRPMSRRVTDNTLEADWGSRKATETGFAGDDLFDQALLGDVQTDGDGIRQEGSPGLILFQPLLRADGSTTLAVGLSIPRGGPDHIEAVSRSRARAGTDHDS